MKKFFKNILKVNLGDVHGKRAIIPKMVLEPPFLDRDLMLRFAENKKKRPIHK